MPRISVIGALVVLSQAGLLPGPAISSHGLALAPALGQTYGPSLSLTRHGIASPIFGAALLKAPALIKSAPSLDYVAYPKYQFNYGVQDGHTGDQKTQSEVRDGDVVKGSYSLVEPDGTIRTVTYTADDHNGFNAVVSRSGHAVHPPTPIISKAIVAAPALTSHAYAAPAYGLGHGSHYALG